MKKAILFYHSKTGTTKKYAEEICKHLKSKQIEAKVYPIKEYKDELLVGCDYVFLGCWTHGLMVILQHPEPIWVDFAKKLPKLDGKKVVLFTTYKLLTGSMFKKMRKAISQTENITGIQLKSRWGDLSEKDKITIDGLQ